jgi:hypothetical protein
VSVDASFLFYSCQQLSSACHQRLTQIVSTHPDLSGFLLELLGVQSLVGDFVPSILQMAEETLHNDDPASFIKLSSWVGIDPNMAAAFSVTTSPTPRLLPLFLGFGLLKAARLHSSNILAKVLEHPHSCLTRPACLASLASKSILFLLAEELESFLMHEPVESFESLSLTCSIQLKFRTWMRLWPVLVNDLQRATHVFSFLFGKEGSGTNTALSSAVVQYKYALQLASWTSSVMGLFLALKRC